MSFFENKQQLLNLYSLVELKRPANGIMHLGVLGLNWWCVYLVVGVAD